MQCLKHKYPSKIVHLNLLFAKKLVYKPSGLILQNLKTEVESAGYAASEFTIKNHLVKFRVSKTTPIRIVHFTTFWKRIEKEPILPYEFNDPFDFLVVSVEAKNHFDPTHIRSLFDNTVV